MFSLHFHFLFSFSENCFHFQKIRILKTCLVWLLVFCFQEIKTPKIYDILTFCLLVFLGLLKIKFFVIAFSFYPKWDFCFQLKMLKMRLSCFHFLLRLEKYFHWKYFQKSYQTHFHHHFLFSVKMKTRNNQTKHPLSLPELLLDVMLVILLYL